jgi:30S ribosomal protein S31
MGKGDIKSRKGKMANGSFGKRRLRNETRPKAVPVVAAAPEPKAKPEKAKAKKAEK